MKLLIAFFCVLFALTVNAQKVIGTIGSNEKENNDIFSEYAFVYGDVDTLGLSESQKKVVRRNNYTYLKEIIEDAKATNQCVDFPAKRIQIHLLPGDKISVNDQELVCFVGADKKSVLEIFPKAPIRGSDMYVFEAKDGGSFKFENIHFDGGFSFAKSEVYAAVLTVGGDATKIKIQDTTQIRNGFWNSSLNGAKVGIKFTSADNTARTQTIASYNAGTRVITLTAPLEIATASDFADNGTLIAVTWNTDEVHKDTVARYARRFQILEDVTETHFIYGAIGELNFSKQAYTIFKNCRMEGFGTGIYISGGWNDVFIDNSYFQGDVIALTKYNGIGYGNPSTVHFTDSELAYSGTELIANAITPYGTQNNNLLWGSGSYNHPSTRVVVSNSYIHDNYTGAFRQFSDGSEKSSPDWFASYFTNTTFRNNAEYHLLTSNTHRSVIENCTFDNGIVNLCYSTDVSNSAFINSYVNLYGYGNAQPKPDTDTLRLTVNVKDSRFLGLSTFSNSWGESRSKRLTMRLTNCDYELMPIAAQYSQKISSGNYATLIVDKARVFSRYTADYPDPATNTKGQLLQGVLHVGHRTKLYVDNLNYDTIRHSLPIVYLNRTDIPIGVVKNSRLLGTEMGFSQTGSNYGLAYENVEMPYMWYAATTGNNYISAKRGFTTKTVGTVNIDEVNVSNCIMVTPNFHQYLIKSTGDIENIIFGIESITSLSSLKNNKWAGFSGSIVVAADTAFCLNGNGNILLDTALCIDKGEVVIATHYPLYVYGSETITRDTIVANGTSTIFTKSGNLAAGQYEPGKTKIYVNSDVVATDDYNEGLTGTGVSGFAQYLVNSYIIEFTTPPTNGSLIIIERSSRSLGKWRIY